MKHILFFVASISLLLPSQAQCTGPVFCCPRAGPDGRYLQLQQTNQYQILCSYGRDPVYRKCAYDATSNNGQTLSTGCPSNLTPAPFSLSDCPLTNELYSKVDSKKCVEVRGANYANGTPIQINDCNGQNHQRFVFRQGTNARIQVAGTNFCLDAGPDPKAGTLVEIRTCDDANSGQDWMHVSNQIYHSGSGKGLVINLPNGSANNGNQLDLQPQLTGDPKQTWPTYP